MSESDILESDEPIEFIAPFTLDTLDSAIKSKSLGLERVPDPPGVVFFLPRGLGELRLSGLSKEKTLVHFGRTQPDLDPAWGSLTPGERISRGKQLIKERSEAIRTLMMALTVDLFQCRENDNE